jgi:hypothetical protein
MYGTNNEKKCANYIYPLPHRRASPAFLEILGSSSPNMLCRSPSQGEVWKDIRAPNLS